MNIRIRGTYQVQTNLSVQTMQTSTSPKNQTVYYECDLIYANNEQFLGIITDSILGHMCTLRISKSLHIKWFKY